jgi:serine/threonine protein kinase
MLQCLHCRGRLEPGARYCPHCGKAVPNDVADPYIGHIVSQRYRIESRIAKGGMGEVYKARHLEMNQAVAVKILHRRFAEDDTVAQRFLNEARSACKVRHPMAVSIYDFGRLDDGSLFLTMEYVNGLTLSEFILRNGPLEPMPAIRIAMQLCEVLASAHAEQVIHRDVKPDNIMVFEGAGGRMSIKVLDFGIAKMLDDDHSRSMTQAGTAFGTPEYMSPEQASGARVDIRTDIYATGLVIYTMLAGDPPFVGSNKLGLLQRHITEKPVPIQQRSKHNVPDTLAGIIHRALSKNPADRPQTMEAFLSELDEIMHGIQGRSTPGTAASQGGSTAQRSANPTAAASASKASGGRASVRDEGASGKARGSRSASSEPQLGLALDGDGFSMGDNARVDDGFSLGGHDDDNFDIGVEKALRPRGKGTSKTTKPTETSRNEPVVSDTGAQKPSRSGAVNLSSAGKDEKSKKKRGKASTTTTDAFRLDDVIRHTSGHQALPGVDDDDGDFDGAFDEDNPYHSPPRLSRSPGLLIFASVLGLAVIFGVAAFAWKMVSVAESGGDIEMPFASLFADDEASGEEASGEATAEASAGSGVGEGTDAGANAADATNNADDADAGTTAAAPADAGTTRPAADAATTPAAPAARPAVVLGQDAGTAAPSRPAANSAPARPAANTQPARPAADTTPSRPAADTAPARPSRPAADTTPARPSRPARTTPPDEI